MKPPTTIDAALRHPKLLGKALGNAGSWSVWFAVLRAAFGLKLTPEQQTLFAQVAGGRAPPTKRVRELWAMVGRKGGKSKMAGALAVYIALFVKHKLSRCEGHGARPGDEQRAGRNRVRLCDGLPHRL